MGDYISDIVFLNGAVLQGAIFGMETFLALFDDLKPPLPLLNYVDDSTMFDIIKKSELNSQSLQSSINETTEWTHKNDMKMNTQKRTNWLFHFTKKSLTHPR